VELASRFGVTRSTVDRSIAVLAAKGLVSSRQGSGTYVTRDRVPCSVALVGGPPPTLNLSSLLCRIDVVPEQSAGGRAPRATLGKYDGLLWFLPSARALGWAAEMQGGAPQIVINRHSAEFNHVSTAHRDAIRGITAERLALAPGASAFFLRPPRDPESLVSTMREEGFVDACREARRFYEVVEMPPTFERKVRALGEIAAGAGGQPLLLVSAGVEQTGAVMAWAREERLAWRKDLWYSDFDDDADILTWGVKVTSFLQDYQRLLDLAIDRLLALLAGTEQSVGIVIPPIRAEGET
jgi:DNA-binding LacI/PurR family transcriptional regulator